MKRILITITVATGLLLSATTQAEELVDGRKLKAREIADEITAMRSERAAALIGSETRITPELFKSVCGAVKKRAMEIAQAEGVRIRHAAIKNRNPDHAATAEEVSMHRIFEEKGSPEEISGETTIKGERYFRYVKPLFVEPACLKCHGEKGKRPAFIKKKYPDDKAYGFQSGDLRGIIEVMIPQP